MKMLKLLSAACVVLVVAAATLRAEVQRLERLTDRHEAYVYIHRQYVERLNRTEDVVRECNEWMGRDDSGFELPPYNGEGLRWPSVVRRDN
jgi:HAMP domain-containing protein